MSDESRYTHKEECPNCGSRDNLARYTDGHGYCFGCQHYEPPTDSPSTTQRKPTMAKDFAPTGGTIRALPKRGLTEATCSHFGYTVGTHRFQVEKDEWEELPAQIASYYKDGTLVAQHMRSPRKHFAWTGNAKGVELFGQNLWRDGGKKVVITEGEIDAMSVSQMQGNKWPVVSIPSGANSAEQALRDNIEWLDKFDEVVLMFDMDEPGKAAVEKCAPLFTPGKCKVASLPLKDANEMLVAGRGSEIIDAIWGAKPYRPDGIRAVSELMEAACADVEMGIPWWLEWLTDATYGRRDGECYAFGAGTGVGKTDWFTQSIAYDVLTLGVPTGVLYLEQPPVETIRRIAGKVVGKPLHIPGKATQAERRAAIESLAKGELLHLYDNFGATDWEVVKAKIRFMAVGLGCRHIYLDHLTALVANELDERKALDKIMAELATLALELRIKVHFISHLTRPSEGKPHEEGGRVMIRHFRGSNAIGMWSHFMFGIERNQQAVDEADRFTIFRILKDRNTGQATGKTRNLAYDVETGLLSDGGPVSAPEGSPFRDRTASSTDDSAPF